MKKTMYALPLLALTLLSACGSPTPSTWTAPEPGMRNETVAAVLPVGSYTVIGEFSLDGEAITKLDGYVNFGTMVDGADCSADYTLANARATSSEEQGFPSSVRVVHPEGDHAWYQPLPTDAVSELWLDISDPASPTIPLMFIPAMVASDWNPGVVEGAGTGELCSIPVMARFMNLDGVRLVFDADRTAAATLAGRARWTEKFVDATGLTGGERDKYIKQLLEVAAPDFTTLTTGVTLTVSQGTDGVIEMRQTKEGSPAVLFIRFTPTELRIVQPVVAKGYFEQVADEFSTSALNGNQFLERQFGR